MNVLLISQCDKRALTETRRIIDQFAQRCGDRTWQTPITQDGLDTLRQLLKKTARKNTAVACHWLRSGTAGELLWVVGDRRRFNAQGAVPTNTTQRNVLRNADERHWHTGEAIHLLAAIAALWHDMGKASLAFQQRLNGLRTERNAYRHEWASLRLFQAFVGNDPDAVWLQRLADPLALADTAWMQRLCKDGLSDRPPKPFQALAHAPLAQAVGWLVVTHHRLPVKPDETSEPTPFLGRALATFNSKDLAQVLMHIHAGWNEAPHGLSATELAPYWTFAQGLPTQQADWQQQAAKLAQRLGKLLAHSPASPWLHNPFVMHLARLSLMLADHQYSSLHGASPERVQVAPGCGLYANTCQLPSGKSGMNQTLDEHLIGVARRSQQLSHALPHLQACLPHLSDHRALRQRSPSPRFRWQDQAAALATQWQVAAAQSGGFVVNMASTGCGKTLGNARIMNALADPALGLRCTFAMGLRTLTLQTGRAFRDLLKLGADELAIRVGGVATRELFEYHQAQAEASGSASTQSLLDEDAPPIVGGATEAPEHPLVAKLLRDPAMLRFVASPLLVCTIDHLTPATESQRGGRQISPMLRLLTSDLVLDEPDDFDVQDLPALTRLVHWAGLLGARVLLSSATLAPSLVQGLFAAYLNGRQHFQRNRGATGGPGAPAPAVACLWVDEFDQHASACADASPFEQTHRAFVQGRVKRLSQELGSQARRLAALWPLHRPMADPASEPVEALLARQVLQAALALHHSHHSQDPHSGKRVSFGLIRMANIQPLVQVALALVAQGAPPGHHIHLCVYHAQYPLLLRSAIEQQLDQTLQRHDPLAVFARPAIRQRLDSHAAPHQLFIVLGSPVTEVGRDHDYDWAVVEPSSTRSLIQLAGRVKRHRYDACDCPNIQLLSTNLRHLKHPGKAAFCRPGYEKEQGEFRLAAHDLSHLLRPEEWRTLDARPRIAEVVAAQPQHKLVDLEHARTRAQMLPGNLSPSAPASLRPQRGRPEVVPAVNAASWWSLPPQDALLTAVLPQQQRFRDDSGSPDIELELRPDEDGDLHLWRREPKRGGPKGSTIESNVDCQLHRLPPQALHGSGISPWGVDDYASELAQLADAMHLSLTECARRFGTVRVGKPRTEDTAGWVFHPALGLIAKARP